MPNPRPKGVGDGEQVNIPALLTQDGTLANDGVGQTDDLRALYDPDIRQRPAKKTA